MIIDISEHEYTIIWDNIYYFALSNYPNISNWELKKIIHFIEYENTHNRHTEIKCNNNILKLINYAIANPDLYKSTKKPKKITECKACKQEGCLTDYLCHTASIENAISIFRCGKLLSTVKVRNKSNMELAKESRNSAKDTYDYFDYIMFSWGNCQAGDRLVMERLLEKIPDEKDLSIGFKPGVRFYFKYETMIKHKNYVNDGYHPAKIKDELILSDFLFCCIIPSDYKTLFLIIVMNIKIKYIF